MEENKRGFVIYTPSGPISPVLSKRGMVSWKDFEDVWKDFEDVNFDDLSNKQKDMLAYLIGLETKKESEIKGYLECYRRIEKRYCT